ncbi:hypothetical protein CAPTEDRAFT_226487 [Capitella teleta]|uniref:Uncharacterized protein n=1 Tax=Capitella teleta TaxID=283909 RepID=R7UCK7_CAPTE|nr:hypothetical protein CAPTEDRAFT_226487 [Capitella teleta]|eukprot:ELU03846.1 hypothetical protein CAPTEDRAFT_226487 [Capitella teleta]
MAGSGEEKRKSPILNGGRALSQAFHTMMRNSDKKNEMHQQLLRVEGERDSAVKSNQHLRKCLHTHQQTLERTLAQAQRALEEQYCLLQKQDTVIQGYLRGSTNNSAILDLACMVVSVFVVQTPLFKYTVTLITAGGKPNKSPQWLRYFWVLQLYVIMKFALKKSKVASKFVFICIVSTKSNLQLFSALVLGYPGCLAAFGNRLRV